MKLNKALKEKKKLLKKIDEHFNRIQKYNSVEEGQKVPYYIPSELESFNKLTKELVELKTKIHLANSPVYSKIFTLSELKNTVNKLRSVKTDEGKVRSGYGSSEPIIKIASINTYDKDQMILQLEEEIDTIQNELEEFNATTSL